MLAEALGYLAKNWQVFPLKDKRTPLVHWRSIEPTPELVLEWWTENPDAWIACKLGTPIIRIDADGAVPRELLEKLDPTLQFSTPSGGTGYIYRMYPGIWTHVVWSGEGHSELRVQADGAYTVLPPSPGYVWTNSLEPSELPEFLRLECEELVLKELEHSILPWIASPDSGTMHSAVRALSQERADVYTDWLQVGIALHSADKDEEYLPLWIEFSKRSNKFKEGECERLWSSFKRNGQLTFRSVLHWAKLDTPGWRSASKYEPFTDRHNGKVLARVGSGCILWCDEWSEWLAWDGRRWERRAESAVNRLYKETLDRRYDETNRRLGRARLISDSDEREKYFKRILATLKACRKSYDGSSMRESVRSARDELPVYIKHCSSFDRKPWLLNCPNGTLDLQTLELRPHDPKDMLTQLCPTEYWPNALCPRWLQFMDEVFAGDTELIAWMQRFLGYCLTGSTYEHVLPVWYGTGRNGKGTLVRAMHTVLGRDYASVCPSGFLLQSERPKHHEIVELFAKRFVAELETDDTMRLNESLVKRLTGGDRLKGRELYQQYWEFDPTHKIVLATNYEPAIRGSDPAIWGRIRKVPFKQCFLGREEKDLDAKLELEAPGILHWLIEGCTAWQKAGYRVGETEAVSTATNEYKEEQDSVGQFLEQMYMRDKGKRLLKSAVTVVYRQWCATNGVQQMSPKSFGQAMARHGILMSSCRNYYLELVPRT